jgi:deoxyribonuclease V
MRSGTAGGPCLPGLRALTLGPVIEQTVQALSRRPSGLLLDATPRDHPRRAGLALHLDSELHTPTIGVTHRLLVDAGECPSGSEVPRIGNSVVGGWLWTQPSPRYARSLCIRN